MEEIPQRWKQPEGEDRFKMEKEAKAAEMHLANGSAWSSQTNYMRRNKGRCDIFLGIEHRLWKEEMEEQFNKEAKEGWEQAFRTRRIHQEVFL